MSPAHSSSSSGVPVLLLLLLIIASSLETATAAAAAAALEEAAVAGEILSNAFGAEAGELCTVAFLLDRSANPRPVLTVGQGGGGRNANIVAEGNGSQ